LYIKFGAGAYVSGAASLPLRLHKNDAAPCGSVFGSAKPIFGFFFYLALQPNLFYITSYLALFLSIIQFSLEVPVYYVDSCFTESQNIYLPIFPKIVPLLDDIKRRKYSR
jgi:hypothetical protein